MTPQRKLKCSLNLQDLNLEVYLYMTEKENEYEIHLNRKLLFQDLNYMPPKGTFPAGFDILITYLQYTTKLLHTTPYTNEQDAWLSGREFKTLCKHLQEYEAGIRKRVKYFKEACMYYKKDLNARLFDLVYKRHHDGREIYYQTTFLEEAQKTALLNLLAADEQPAVQQQLQQAIEDTFNRSEKSETMKGLWIFKDTSLYRPINPGNKATELKQILQFLIKNY